MWTLVKQFAGTVIPGVMKPLRVMWNEMVGFVFIVFAVMIMGSTVRKWDRFRCLGRLARNHCGRLIFFFLVMMAGIRLYSFFRARKINRSK